MAKGGGSTRTRGSSRTITKDDVLGSLESFGYGYDNALNEYLRNPDATHSRYGDYEITKDVKKSFENNARNIEKAFDLLPTENHLFMWRGLAFNTKKEYDSFVKSLQKGTVTDAGFPFVSTSKKEAYNYADNGKYRAVITYEDVRSLDISKYNDGSAHEGEHILQRNVKYRVKEISSYGGRLHVKLKMM